MNSQLVFSLEFIISQINRRTPIGPCRIAFFRTSRYGNLTWRTWRSFENIIASGSFWIVRKGARKSCYGCVKVWMRLGSSRWSAVHRNRFKATSQRKLIWHRRKVIRPWWIHMRRHLSWSVTESLVDRTTPVGRLSNWPTCRFHKVPGTSTTQCLEPRTYLR